MLLWALASAILNPPSVEPPIARSSEVLLSEYADPTFDLLRVLSINPQLDRGNLSAEQNADAVQHLQEHSRAPQGADEQLRERLLGLCGGAEADCSS